MIRPLGAAAADSGKIQLSGSFGVFFSGQLLAHFYDRHGGSLGTMPIADVSPTEAVSLDLEVTPPGKSSRLSLHLIDESGSDRAGALQEVEIRDLVNHSKQKGHTLAILHRFVLIWSGAAMQLGAQQTASPWHGQLSVLLPEGLFGTGLLRQLDFVQRRLYRASLQRFAGNQTEPTSAQLHAGLRFPSRKYAAPGSHSSGCLAVFMYITSSNDVFALDARTGRSVWRYSRPISSGLLDDAAAHKSRGVAVWDHFVYSETDDAHLLCLDARSGNLIWDVQFADKAKHYGGTSAPLVVKRYGRGGQFRRRFGCARISLPLSMR